MIQKFFILICFAQCIAQQELPFLPGVKDLTLGFDAVKMREQSSRFPIFDLSERSRVPFVVKTADQERSYAVPAMVQVTDTSIWREIDCESIALDFQQFYYR